jgi:hypothetical protein
MMKQILLVFLACTVLAPMPGRTQTKSIVGAVTGFKPEAAEIEVKPDNGAAVSVKLTADTVALKIAPGEKDLKKAEPIKVTDVAIGDKVLVTLAAGNTDVRRIIVMSATDISKRDQADRMDWNKRGVSGIVSAKNGNDITLKKKSLSGADVLITVTVGDKTTYKRYAPDSVKFADARNSNLAEVSVGDQVRARGQKNEDGSKVSVEDLVFGTFITKGGTITAVSPESNEITVKELGTGKPLVIKVTADSQLKMMPDIAAMMGGRGGAQGPGGQGAAGAPGAGRPAMGAPAGGGPAMGGRGGMPDIAQMLEMMPAAKLDQLKLGGTVIVSSTKGAQEGQITAIMMLANADALIQMVSMQSGAGRGGGAGMQGPSMAGLGGMDFPSIIQ